LALLSLWRFISTLNRYTPKVVVLEVDLKDIYKDKENFGKEILVEHAPFYKKYLQNLIL